MPKGIHGRAKAAIKEITHAQDRKEALKAVEEFAKEFGAKWPKAAEKITSEREALLTFYDYLAEHWRHLRTTNPIESVFAPVRGRTDITKGPGSRAAGLAMIFKLMEAAEGRWRKLSGSHLVALVRAGAEFVNGGLAEGRRVIRSRSTTAKMWKAAISAWSDPDPQGPRECLSNDLSAAAELVALLPERDGRDFIEACNS
jgi:hypothetical protein